MKLNEYLAENGVKLMIKGSGEKNPTRQTNNLGMYDYVENLENVLGKMAWICDYRANAEPTKGPIRNIKPTPRCCYGCKRNEQNHLLFSGLFSAGK